MMGGMPGFAQFGMQAPSPMGGMPAMMGGNGPGIPMAMPAPGQNGNIAAGSAS